MTIFGASVATERVLDSTSTLAGYEIIRPIGEGAASIIYAASHPVTRQVCALKHVIRKTDKDIRFVQQLESEHEVGHQVRHPALRRNFELKINKNLLFKVTDAILIMELFDGRSLEQDIPKTLAGIIEVFIKTAQALDSLHLMGYVHCDLKPNNILISESGEVKVIDLGQACKSGTVKKRIQGTPDYIAPEQVKLHPVTFKTDIYNLGATMYWALTGKKLPTLYTLKKSANSFLVDDQLPAPHTVNPQLPESLSRLVMECVKINPTKRPKGMADVIHRLELIHHVLISPPLPPAEVG